MQLSHTLQIMDAIERTRKCKTMWLNPEGPISASVGPVLPAAKSNWQSWMHILAELSAHPFKMKIPGSILNFLNPQWML